MKVTVAVLLLSVLCVSQDAKSFYDEAMNKLTGVSPTRSELRGVELMNQAADRGYLPAIIALGTIYDAGKYVGSNPSKAGDLYRKAAGQGSHFSEYLLGRMYYTGTYGTGRRDGEKWLQSAADAGNPFAAYLLGDSIYDRDPNEAVRWFRAGAEQGLPYAQYRLGKAFNVGGRVPIDKRQAYLWLYVAREAGVSEAATDVSLLESELGTTAVETAKTEARELWNRVRRASNPTRCKGWAGELDVLPTIPPLELLGSCE